MMLKKLKHILLIAFLISVMPVHAAVILQYHHVSETLPAVTSVSEDTFKSHMTYLEKNQFNVIPLDKMIDSLQAGKPLPKKTVAITFDDGYENNIISAAPILKQFGFPYTIFVNPKLIDEGQSYVMTWSALKELAKQGALIANHSAKHDYLHKKLSGESSEQWSKRIKQDLIWSQKRIKEEIGHDLPYIAYPYGEFNNELQALVKSLGLIGIGQHSGAVGIHSDFTRLPRFPASGFYSKLDTLKVKLNTLPFAIEQLVYDDSVTSNPKPELVIKFKEKDFYKSQFACFISGVGQANLDWKNKLSVKVTSPKALKQGRSRFNCTAPSKSHSGQYFWFSQPWVRTQ